ncbi:MAG: phage portal protein [Rhizobiaceae bacterium]
MKVFGFTITRDTKPDEEKGMNSLTSRGSWWPTVFESFAGAWQQNVEIKLDSVLTHTAVFRCVSLIASDIAKMQVGLIQVTEDDIWVPYQNAAHTPVLLKPNRNQTRIQFFRQWMISKLIHGNTYVLKARDSSGIVRAMYILDPTRVWPHVSEDGQVWYSIGSDNFNGLANGSEMVPSSEIIHDHWNEFFHPLVGVSPIFAAGLSAVQGLSIQKQSAKFFQNAANPSGFLHAPGSITPEIQKNLAEQWNSNYRGDNQGKVAVLANGLKFERMSMTPVDAQLIQQLQFTGKDICTAFGMPPYKIGIETPPAQANIEALGQQYWNDCLQCHIEDIEELLDVGLSLPKDIGIQFDLDGLFRMDTKSLAEVETLLVGGGISKPNESRKKFNKAKVKGGDTPYMQQQNYSLSALDERDRNNPAPSDNSTKPQSAPAKTEPPKDDSQSEKLFDALVSLEFAKGINNVRYREARSSAV